MSKKICKIGLTERSKENLCKLATYLQSLPEDYNHFAMNQWFKTDNLSFSDIRRWLEGKMRSCGTAACAAGHGPAAGIPMPEDLKSLTYSQGANWGQYCMREFLALEDGSCGQQNLAMSWCFGGGWSLTDDHHYGAAARIRYLLNEGGIPPDFFEGGGYAETKVYQKYRVDKQILPTDIPAPVSEKEFA